MTADFADLRIKMVDGQVRTTDVTSLPLLSAMLSIPRELFVPDARRGLAYIEEDIPLSDSGGGGDDRYLMKPSPFAKLIQLAEISAGDKVLIVGAGRGYSAAVIARLANSVVALESDDSLADKAVSTLSGLGIANVSVVRGPLSAGYGQSAPYDVIVIEGGVEELPSGLLEQLTEGGRLVAVEGHGNAGVARIYLKADGVASGRKVFNAAVKQLPGFERLPEFEF